MGEQEGRVRQQKEGLQREGENLRGDRFVHSFDGDDYFKGITHIKTNQTIHFKYAQFTYVLNKNINRKSMSYNNKENATL